jgi:hypothetical protein
MDRFVHLRNGEADGQGHNAKWMGGWMGALVGRQRNRVFCLVLSRAPACNTVGGDGGGGAMLAFVLGRRCVFVVPSARPCLTHRPAGSTYRC